MVKTIEYLNLSALAYADFKKSDTGLTLDEIIRDEQKNKSRKNFNLSDPQLFALQDSSNPLRSFVLLSQSPLTYTRTVKDRNGIRTITVENEFSCIALQNPETKEIIFAFRGTNNFGDWDTDGLIGSRVFQQTGWGNLLLLESLFFKLSINMALFVITIRRRCLRLLVKVATSASLGTLSAVRWPNI